MINLFKHRKFVQKVIIIEAEILSRRYFIIAEKKAILAKIEQDNTEVDIHK